MGSVISCFLLTARWRESPLDLWMSTVLDDDAVIDFAKGLDWTKLTLTHEQGFLLSRVPGRVSVRDLVASSGMKDGAARGAIMGLVRVGALVLDEASLAKASSAATLREEKEVNQSVDEFSGFRFDAAELAEAVELNEKQRKRILFVNAHLTKWNHYALLGLKRTAKSGDIKKGYFKASKEFHPDAYFRKELGTYRPKLDLIFRAMKVAYDVLSHADQRSAYDQTLGADFSPEEISELEARADAKRVADEAIQKEQNELERAARRGDRLAERLKNKRLARNPMLDYIKKGQEYAQLAKTAFATKDMNAAARHAKMAIEFSRGHPSVVAEVDEVLRRANLEKATLLARQLANALAPDDERIRAAAEQIEELAPESARHLLDAASLYSDLKDRRSALRLAQQATLLEPELEKGWVALLDYAELNDQLNTALRAAEHLQSLDPKRPGIKDTVKRLRRLLR